MLSCILNTVTGLHEFHRSYRLFEEEITHVFNLSVLLIQIQICYILIAVY